MLRPLATVAVTLCTALALLAPTPTYGAEEYPRPDDTGSLAEVVTRAEQALRGTGSTSSSPGAARLVGSAAPASASLALRDLFAARPSLDARSRARADALLARPTDGPGDEFGDGYRVGSTRKCNKSFCVHYVTSTSDAATTSYVATMLSTLKKVLKLETGKLGYRKPPKDGKSGGNGKFDVYLKDVGARGLFGYCSPERFTRGTRSASSYCVLDNDFSRTQFGAAPRSSLRVTTAHEFFHAVQFGYDFTEDGWLLESTATWMEERFADSANDNRRYLKASQLRSPGAPLDRFNPPALGIYGNWVFWEFLSGRYGNRVVRNVWNRAATFRGAPDQFSVAALRRVLRPRGGLTANFTRYAAGNLFPGRLYPEGKTYPRPKPDARAKLGKRDRKAKRTVRVDHLASRNVKVKPDKSLKGKRWKLRASINAPGRKASPGAIVTVKRRNGRLLTRQVSLGSRGRGRVTVPFGRRKAKAAFVTVANVSTRYRCGRETVFACSGKPRDQKARFAVKLRAVKR